MTSLARISAALLIAASFGPSAFAHHSGAMFDNAHPQTFSGTIRAFNWTNPHVSVEIVSDTNAPKPSVLWTLEGSSPGVMTRSGWTKRSLNPGDRVTVTVAPLRDGGLGGGLRKVVLADGKVLTQSVAALPNEAPR